MPTKFLSHFTDVIIALHQAWPCTDHHVFIEWPWVGPWAWQFQSKFVILIHVRPPCAGWGEGTHWSHRGLLGLSGCTYLVFTGLWLVTQADIRPLIGHDCGPLLPPSLSVGFCPASHTLLGPSRSPAFFCSEHRALLLHQRWLFRFGVRVFMFFCL